MSQTLEQEINELRSAVATVVGKARDAEEVDRLLTRITELERAVAQARAEAAAAAAAAKTESKGKSTAARIMRALEAGGKPVSKDASELLSELGITNSKLRNALIKLDDEGKVWVRWTRAANSNRTCLRVYPAALVKAS